MGRDFLPAGVMASNLGFGRDVLLLDDFEGTFAWVVSGTGGDAWVGNNVQAAFEGVYGVMMRSRLTGPQAGDVVYISRKTGFSESGLIVFRAMLCLYDVSTSAVLQLSMDMDDGATLRQCALRLAPNTPSMSYRNSAGTYTAIAALAFPVRDGQWFVMELVVDARTGEYVLARFDGVEADLSGVAVYDAGASTGRGVTFWLQVSTAAAAATIAYVDNVYAGECLDL